MTNDKPKDTKRQMLEGTARHAKHNRSMFVGTAPPAVSIPSRLMMMNEIAIIRSLILSAHYFAGKSIVGVAPNSTFDDPKAKVLIIT